MRIFWLLLAWLAVREVCAISKCGIEVVDSTSTRKRSIGFLRLERNVTRTVPTKTSLARRMELPQSGLGGFYENEFPKLSKLVVTRDTAPDATWMSAAIIEEYTRVRQKEWSTGVEGLKGCTVLYIISRKAVYATHWWENVSFSPDTEWRNPKTQTNSELFQLTITNMLRNGGRYHAKLDAYDIEDDHIRAYLIHPSNSWEQLTDPSAADYTIQYNQIRTTVGELVPTLKEQSRWTDIPYVRVASDLTLDNKKTVRGRSLFKYDRAHDIGGGKTERWAMLWVEAKLYHQDKW
ncbi:hypothetical protein FE257_003000 [Aspergillus nanangensis]|uniref:Uncharacterized protein n=1 Tax=Aspergillus nanangensis TaxID=2582783 RepID=A0AAD4CC70_ASPNN|nr:hypothetical protein FE257_003000 [Aspergillus nanangensis]